MNVFKRKIRAATGIRNPDRPARRAVAVPTTLPGSYLIIMAKGIFFCTLHKLKLSRRLAYLT